MEKNQLIIAVLLGTTVFILLTGFLLFFLIRYRTKKNQYIREKENLQKEFGQILLQSQVEVQENTFADLSAELHDNIGQLLVSTKALIGVTQRQMLLPMETLQIADETLAKAINEIRSLSKLLDKDWLKQFDFIDNLDAEVKRIGAMKTLEINFIHPGKIMLPPEEQVILFRIVQEALQNSVKHSNAGKIDIALTHSAYSLIVNISDNGNSFEKDDKMHTSLGLKNMQHRTNMLGGTIEWLSSAANGSAVIIKLPVKKSEL